MTPEEVIAIQRFTDAVSDSERRLNKKHEKHIQKMAEKLEALKHQMESLSQKKGNLENQIKRAVIRLETSAEEERARKDFNRRRDRAALEKLRKAKDKADQLSVANASLSAQVSETTRAATATLFVGTNALNQANRTNRGLRRTVIH